MLIRILDFVLISWVAQEIMITKSASGQQIGANTIDLEYIRAKCSKKLDFDTIQEFKHFMGQFSKLNAADYKNNKPDELIGACLEHRPALVELEQLVDGYDRKRPCKSSEVAKLEDYAVKHFMVKKRPWSLKFFTLFGVNIGLACKLNLLAHLKQADSEVDPLDFIYSMASPTGWNVLINEHTKKTMKFGSSSNAGNSVINRIAKLVPGLTLVEQFDYAAFNHPMNDKAHLNSGGWTGVESATYEAVSSSTAQRVREFLLKIVQSCQNLDQLYYNSILSLARLNELGLLVGVKQLDEMHESSLMLHRWLAAASFCQIMARVEVAPRDDQTGQLQLRMVHDDDRVQSRQTLYSYAAELGEISALARDHVWLASVADGKWLRHDEAMFKPAGGSSFAINRLRQFIKGLERDYIQFEESKLV